MQGRLINGIVVTIAEELEGGVPVGFLRGSPASYVDALSQNHGGATYP